jgi:hypothetical protein
MSSVTESMLANSIPELIKSIVEERGISDRDEFTAYLSNNPSVMDEIVELSKSVGFLNFSDVTYDGWYCIHESNDQYRIYYKERGQIYDSKDLVEGRALAVSAILCAVNWLNI